MGCGRYIDDLLMINNDHAMDKAMFEIYPKELNLVPDESTGQSVSFLDLKLVIKDCLLKALLRPICFLRTAISRSLLAGRRP